MTVFGGSDRGYTPRHVATIDPLAGEGQARNTDPPTSHRAAITHIGRKGSQRWLLLEAHAEAEDRLTLSKGLTDEEACEWAGLPLVSEYATRCSELRRLGFIAPTGETRRGSGGIDRIVSRITPPGQQLIKDNANG